MKYVTKKNHNVKIHLYELKMLGYEFYICQTACGLSLLNKNSKDITKITCKKCLNKAKVNS